MLSSAISGNEVIKRRTALDRFSSQFVDFDANLPADSSSSSSSSPSTAASPLDSLSRSQSYTSLSSLASSDTAPSEHVKFQEKVSQRGQQGGMVDGYGNTFDIPEYTMKQIRDAIPVHCYERSALRGLAYVARDVASLACTFYLFRTYVTPETVPSFPLRFGLWSLYTFIQGCFGTGLWIMAHECGHQVRDPLLPAIELLLTVGSRPSRPPRPSMTLLVGSVIP